LSLDVAEEPAQEQEVDWSIAEHLIGNVRLAGLRIPSLRDIHQPEGASGLSHVACRRLLVVCVSSAMAPAGVDGQGLQMRTTAIMTGVRLADPQELAARIRMR
jgi:hypothetical protein